MIDTKKILCVCVTHFVSLKFNMHIYAVLFYEQYVFAPDVVEWAVCTLYIE